MLDEYSAADIWLKQFPIVQREVGRQLLRSLRLISHSEFERELDVVLERLTSERRTENMALMSVSETVSLRRLKNNRAGLLRIAGSSADRVRNYAENFSRVHFPRVKAHPTIESMRSERIRNVVLIEDFIGTGRRIATFLKRGIHPSLKSWISYGWTKLWIVAYGGSTDGLRAVQRCGFGLSDDRIRLVTPVRHPCDGLTEPMVRFCSEYARRTVRSKIPLGFGSIGTTMVFEHSCPNNAPVVLWSKGPRFTPLFPNRGIPSELRPAFGESRASSGPEILWDASQYRLALAMLSEKKHARESSLWPLLVSLGLASRSRWHDKILAAKLGMPIAQVEALRKLAWKLGALDVQTNQLTNFGSALLNRVRSAAAHQRTRIPRKHRDLSEVYYPMSCEGRFRH
jgi:hypothetical protein